MGLLAKGGRRLIELQKRGALPDGAVRYQRKSGTAPIDLTGKAWIGRTVFRRTPPVETGGAAVVFGERDYLIPFEDLVEDLAGVPTQFKPVRGDRILQTLGAEPGAAVKTYEVVTPLGEPEVRPIDGSWPVWRVHVKEVRA